MADVTDSSDDGIDLGWVTSSTAVMTVKHIFSGVGNGDNYSVSGPNSAKGSDKLLKMDKVDSDDSATWDDNESYADAIQIRTDDDVDADGPDPAAADSTNLSACVPTTGAFSYAATIGRNQQPDNCFRLRVVGNAAAGTPKLANYLSGYSVELAAKDSEVAWGDVDWEDEPFADLKCEPMTFVVADQVDVCAMFEDEVDQALEGGWGGSKGTVDVAAMARATVGNAETAAGGGDGSVARMWHVTVKNPGPSPDRFRTLWFDDNLNTKIRKDSNASFERPMQGAVGDVLLTRTGCMIYTTATMTRPPPTPTKTKATSRRSGRW